MNIRKLKKCVNVQNPSGVCLDVVVPSYRKNNNDYLRRIATLRASREGVYVKFWFVVDNPCKDHINTVKELSNELNAKQLEKNGNYFINVIHYGANRGASYARNTGYNYSTADWILFLDDYVIPDENILDAYIGGIKRFPDAKVLAGMTTLPEATNNWTTMLRVCNVGYFYGVSKLRRHPPWAVTANLLVRGSRYNPTIQLKNATPRPVAEKTLIWCINTKTSIHLVVCTQQLQFPRQSCDILGGTEANFATIKFVAGHGETHFVS